MKKRIALLLLLVGAILEAKSFGSRSSSSRSFSSRSSSSRSVSRPSSSSRSSSSSVRSTTTKSSSSSSSRTVSNPRPSTTSTSKTRVNTTNTSTKSTNVNKTSNNTTIINNNNTNVNRGGGGLDLVDYIILDSIVNKPSRSTHTTETVYIEKEAPVVHEDRIQEVRTGKVVTKSRGWGAAGLTGAILLMLVAIVFILMCL